MISNSWRRRLYCIKNIFSMVSTPRWPRFATRHKAATLLARSPHARSRFKQKADSESPSGWHNILKAGLLWEFTGQMYMDQVYLFAVLRPEVGVTRVLTHAVVVADLRRHERKTRRKKVTLCISIARRASTPKQHPIRQAGESTDNARAFLFYHVRGVKVNANIRQDTANRYGSDHEVVVRA